MNWLKLGLVISPDNIDSEVVSRIMCPTPIRLNENTIRVFAGFCDQQGISRPGYFDVDAIEPTILKAPPRLNLLDVGEDGMFDDNGLCPTCVLSEGNHLRMYYFAFQQGVKLPFFMFSGLAYSLDSGENWRRATRVPVLDRSNLEPIMRSGPFVIRDQGFYRIYYPCGTEFIDVHGKKVHMYQIHYAQSTDGINWPDSGVPVIKHRSKDEYGFGRPFVYQEEGVYKMLYSIRTFSKGYRLGYAESMDGINWDRKDDQFKIDVSDSGWDSEMICYSSLIDIDGVKFLFYNGNNLGSTGVGVAKLE